MYVCMYIYIYIYIYIPQTGPFTRRPSLEVCLQKCRSEGIRRQGIVLKRRISLQKSLCPVVICPYLCSSDICRALLQGAFHTTDVGACPAGSGQEIRSPVGGEPRCFLNRGFANRGFRNRGNAPCAHSKTCVLRDPEAGAFASRRSISWVARRPLSFYLSLSLYIYIYIYIHPCFQNPPAEGTPRGRAAVGFYRIAQPPAMPVAAHRMCNCKITYIYIYTSISISLTLSLYI